MLQDSISKIKFLFVLALLSVLPMMPSAQAGVDIIDNTDLSAQRLVYFYDTIGRSTFIQVTNTTASFVDIHVQVWRADADCAEDNFYDLLTPFGTIVYDVEDLPGHPDLSDSYGFVTISSDPTDALFPIIGMFRIIDDSGYEYRTNAADAELEQFAYFEDVEVINFNEVNGNNLSDVVGITYISLDPEFTYASPLIGTNFGDPTVDIVGEEEDYNSCPEVTFTCATNYGIDNSIPNSQGFDSICNTSKLLDGDAGVLYLPIDTFICLDGLCPAPQYFVGFLGLNNGDGTGSMDSFWSLEAFGLAEVGQVQ